MTDTAGFLSPQTLATLDARLEAVQTQTGHQVVVWIGQSLDGAPLDDWSVRTFAAWKIGRKGMDDGLAVFVFAADRKIDIEVGYGLEGQVTDALAGRVIRRDVMAPKLQAGDRDGAVVAGVDALLARGDHCGANVCERGPCARGEHRLAASLAAVAAAHPLGASRGRISRLARDPSPDGDVLSVEPVLGRPWRWFLGGGGGGFSGGGGRLRRAAAHGARGERAKDSNSCGG